MIRSPDRHAGYIAESLPRGRLFCCRLRCRLGLAVPQAYCQGTDTGSEAFAFAMSDFFRSGSPVTAIRSLSDRKAALSRSFGWRLQIISSSV